MDIRKLKNQRLKGSILKELRKRNELTQEELATKLNITQTRISNFENGLSPIPYSLSVELCKLFDFDIEEFYKTENLEFNNENHENIIKRINKFEIKLFDQLQELMFAVNDINQQIYEIKEKLEILNKDFK